jgi:hypothetical protein
MNDPPAPNATVSSSHRPIPSLLPPIPVVAGTGKWHLLTILAGCMLVVTFFLPACHLHDWSVHAVPATYFRHLLRAFYFRQAVFFGGANDLGTLVYVIAVEVLPHVWGVLAILFSAMSLLGWTRLRTVPQAIGVLSGVLIGSAWVVGVVQLVPMYVQAFSQGLSPSPTWWVWLALVVVTLIVAVVGVLYALLAVRRRSWAYLYHGFAGAGVLVLVCMAFYVYLPLLGWSNAWRYVGLSGMTITSLACCLLLFSRIGEARTLTGLTWRRTLWYLLTLRLHTALRRFGLCPKCGYYLYGLREQRCPECGRPFSFDELGVTSESLDFMGDPSATGQVVGIARP